MCLAATPYLAPLPVRPGMARCAIALRAAVIVAHVVRARKKLTNVPARAADHRGRNRHDDPPASLAVFRIVEEHVGSLDTRKGPSSRLDSNC